MRDMEMTWEAELPGTPEQVWDAITVHSDGWLWPIAYEPREGGAESGLTRRAGRVTAWEPERRFATRAERADGWFNELGYELEPSAGGTRASYRHHTVTAPDEDHDVMVARLPPAHRLLRALAGGVRAALRRPHGDLRLGRRPGGLGPGRRLRPAAARARAGRDAAAGDRVQLRPAGLPPIDAVVDYRTDAFLGLRTDDALIRVYGRDAFGWPVGVALPPVRAGRRRSRAGAGVARLAGRRLHDRGERGLMPQYAVMIFERELPGGVADIPPEVLAAHGALPERIREAGGRASRGWRWSRPARRPRSARAC